MSQAISHDSRGPVRVLVADADPDTRSLYRESLSLSGCDVVEAADGRDALVKALSVRPTLVVTETRLPIFDGYALCKVLRRDSMTHGVPILMVTTETRPTELDRARDAGADGVLMKPVPPDLLLQEIERLLRHPEKPVVPNEPRRKPLAKAHARFETTTPPKRPPELVCPRCDSALVYEHSHIGGVSAKHWEQWDTFRCLKGCGEFEYRQRTKKLRKPA